MTKINMKLYTPLQENLPQCKLFFSFDSLISVRKASVVKFNPQQSPRNLANVKEWKNCLITLLNNTCMTQLFALNVFLLSKNRAIIFYY